MVHLKNYLKFQNPALKGCAMAIIDLVKWNGSPDLLAWKYPMGSSEELSTWTQLIVNESQEAFLVKGGVYEGPFAAGRHTLDTENLPVLRKLIGLPFGGKSPFTAEVWFVNKTINLDVKWGTSDPIQLQDPKFNLMVPVRAFGQYGVRIRDSKKFLLKLVGTVQSFDAETLASYFRGCFITKIKTEISNAIIQQRQSVLVMSTQLEALSAALKAALAPEMDSYGVSLEQFNITSINLPEDDPAVKTLKSALAKRAEMEIVGFDYKQERSFDVLQTAAANEGTAGGMMGVGLGLGVGVGVGAPMGQAAADLARNISTSGPASPAPAGGGQARTAPLTTREKIELIRELEDLRTRGVLTDAEFQAEKRAVMGSDQQ